MAIYMMRDDWRQPTGSTIAYYKMSSDLKDYSGNGRDLTWTATFSDNKATNTSSLSGSTLLSWNSVFTVSLWTTWTWSWFIYDQDNWWPTWACWSTGSSQYSLYNWNFIINWWKRCGELSAMWTASDFVLLTCVYNWSTVTAYKNWVQFWTVTNASGNLNTSNRWFTIEPWTWGEIIVDWAAWTAQDVLDYYNDTKANYSVTDYEYSYDFTTGSTADLSSKWWTVPAGSVVDSNGYYNSSRNWNAMTYTSTDISNAAQNAKSVVLELTWSAGSWHQERVLTINGSSECIVLYWNGMAEDWGNQALFGGVSLLRESTAYGQSWTYTTTLTVDLVNKTWEYVSTGHNTLTWTVTDAAITTFRGGNAIHVYWESSAYIRNINVRITR